MKVNEKIISTKTELLETIKQGVNILDYIKDERDIDFVTNAIVIEKNDEDSYYEETAEIVFKSILYYVLFTEGEIKTLERCREIAKYGMNDIDGINKIKNMVSKEERANVLFKPVEIASEKTQKAVFEKLNERLSKI
ncbi:MAG: hypothetical protein U0K52_00800 [Clostridia bacterium]|nr:hypothetical protein [Clostridia bacterium]